MIDGEMYRQLVQVNLDTCDDLGGSDLDFEDWDLDQDKVLPPPTSTSDAKRNPAQDTDAGSESLNIDASFIVNEEVHDVLEQEKQASVFPNK